MIYEPQRPPKSRTKRVQAKRAAAIADPTRIPIRFDPTQQRMKGAANHGGVPFDVPFISEIAPGLWQGGCQNGLVLPRFINHLVSLYAWEAYTVGHPLDSTLTIRMLDSAEQDLSQIDYIAQWVNRMRKTGEVLVHCQAGLNRSSLVVARALMLEGISAREAIDHIRLRRSPACLCNEAFEKWLLSL